MKPTKICFYLANIFSILCIASLQTSFAQNTSTDVVLFYGEGCPHCANTIRYLDNMKQKYPEIKIHKFEIYFQKDNIQLFQTIAEAYSTGIEAVPTMFIGNHVFVGFNSDIGTNMENTIIECIKETCISPLQFLEENTAENETENTSSVSIRENIGQQENVPGPEEPPVPLEENTDFTEHSDEENVKNISETITLSAVIGAAVVDAINPCAFAVLILLITTILAAGKKRRALFSGLAFSLSIFISYYLMGLGLYSAIQASGLTHTFYLIIAILAVLIGLFNLKDYLWYGKWFLMEVPLSWRPKLKAILKGVTSVPGAFFIGFAVSLFLLPCTSGPYIVILGLLAHTTTKTYAYALLALYNVIFVSPMILITAAVYFGFTTTEQAETWRQGKLKILHLIAGIILLTLGIIMLVSIWLGYF